MPIDWSDPDDPEPADKPISLDRSKLPSAEELDRILDGENDECSCDAKSPTASPVQNVVRAKVRPKPRGIFEAQTPKRTVASQPGRGRRRAAPKTEDHPLVRAVRDRIEAGEHGPLPVSPDVYRALSPMDRAMAFEVRRRFPEVPDSELLAILARM